MQELCTSLEGAGKYESAALADVKAKTLVSQAVKFKAPAQLFDNTTVNTWQEPLEDAGKYESAMFVDMK